MGSVVSLADYRAKSNEPDANCIATDPRGNTVYLFQVLFRHDGRRFEVPIYARSAKDAKKMLKSLRKTAWLEGRVVYSAA